MAKQAGEGREARAFQVTFLPEGTVVDVDVAGEFQGGEGEPGSILDIALAAGVDLDHACGGVCACSTCHVIIRSGSETCSEATDDEEDMLEQAPGLDLDSRLGCQAVPDGSLDLVVEVPDWNRNFGRESPH